MQLIVFRICFLDDFLLLFDVDSLLLSLLFHLNVLETGVVDIVLQLLPLSFKERALEFELDDLLVGLLVEFFDLPRIRFGAFEFFLQGFYCDFFRTFVELKYLAFHHQPILDNLELSQFLFEVAHLRFLSSFYQLLDVLLDLELLHLCCQLLRLGLELKVLLLVDIQFLSDFVPVFLHGLKLELQQIVFGDHDMRFVMHGVDFLLEVQTGFNLLLKFILSPLEFLFRQSLFVFEFGSAFFKLAHSFLK